MPDRPSRFDLIYERHYPQVLAYCTRRVGPVEARAAANEVMSIAWRRIDDLPAGDEAIAWLYGVARRVLSHHWRGNRRRHRLESALRSGAESGSPNPERIVVMRDELDRVLEAVALLSERDQEVLRLAGWEGLSHRQIAEILGCSAATVDQRIHRAKRRLAEKYETVAHARSLRRALGWDEGGAR